MPCAIWLFALAYPRSPYLSNAFEVYPRPKRPSPSWRHHWSDAHCKLGPALFVTRTGSSRRRTHRAVDASVKLRRRTPSLCLVECRT
ncbi:hypothetical protein F5Y03DRAFT_326434 [Xylaria venustula]|nr:hypothetical protein F5Y03DRAFT_326434 [Xylaria venustula]